MRISGEENNTFLLREIGERIRDIRIAVPLTQKEMAEKAGVSPRTVERIENGENVKIENLLNILRTFGLLENLNTLIPEQEVPPSVLLDRGKKRVRAVSRKMGNAKDSEWKWGDEA